MIHNNFRKILKKFSRSSSNVSQFTMGNLTDITGYTGISSDDSNFFRNIYYISYGSPNIWSLSAYDTLLVSTSHVFYARVGNSINNEPDYTLGEYLSDLKLSTIISRDYDYIITTIIVNDTATDKTFDEVGLFYHVGDSSYRWNTDYKYADFLLIKEVLDTPQTIPAGGSISITFNLFGDEPSS